jgi:hypothetical protein
MKTVTSVLAFATLKLYHLKEYMNLIPEEWDEGEVL